MMNLDDSFATFRTLKELPAEEQVELLRSMIDVIPEAVVAHGPDGDLVFWSNGMCGLLGYTRDEIAKLKSFGWVDPEAIRGAPARLETILHDGNLTFESRAVRKDGSSIPTIVTARRIDTRRGPLIVAVLRDLSSLKNAHAELTYLASHDPLTGAANRSAFEERLDVALLDARRHGDNVAVACVDVDRLKAVNDRFGHQVGDTVLSSIAERLKAVVREQDVVARLGSDEFTILLTRVRSHDELGAVADRLLSTVAAPVEVPGGELIVTASCGIALFDPTFDDARTLVVKAGAAMCAARDGSSSGWTAWSEEIGTAPASETT